MWAEQLKDQLETMADGFRDNAPVSAAEAATIILDGVPDRALANPGWRRRPGDKQEVRANPELTYDGDIVERIRKAIGSTS